MADEYTQTKHAPGNFGYGPRDSGLREMARFGSQEIEGKKEPVVNHFYPATTQVEIPRKGLESKAS